MAYSRMHGVALCSAFTRDQLRAVVDFIRSSADPLSEVASVRGATVTPPLLAYMDVGSAVEPQDVLDIIVFHTYLTASELQTPMDVPRLAAILQRGLGLNADYARMIAERCVTPDSDVSGFSWAVLNSLADIPFIPEGPIRRMLLEVGDRAAAVLYEYMRTQGAADTLYEWLLAGRQVREATKREILRSQEAAFELRTLGRRPDARPITPDASIPALPQSGSSSSSSSGIMDALESLLGSGTGEGGDPYEVGEAHDAAREQLKAVVESFSRPTGYNAYARRVEQGDSYEQGFLPVIGALGSMVGSLFGGGGGGGGGDRTPPPVAATSKTAGGRAFDSLRSSSRGRRPDAGSILDTVLGFLGGR